MNPRSESITSKGGTPNGTDYLGLETIPEMQELFNNGIPFREAHRAHAEAIFFSDRVKKINQFDWGQDRILVITSQRVYNFKEKKLKEKSRSRRTIP